MGIMVVYFPPLHKAKVKDYDCLRKLQSVMEKHQGKLALNFLTSRHHNIFTIPKTSNPDHVKENSGSVGWDLKGEEATSINRAFPLPDYDGPLEMI